MLEGSIQLDFWQQSRVTSALMVSANQVDAPYWVSQLVALKVGIVVNSTGVALLEVYNRGQVQLNQQFIRFTLSGPPLSNSTYWGSVSIPS